MNNERYYRLVKNICQLTQIPINAIDPDLFQLNVKGINFNCYNIAETVVIQAEFGRLPDGRRDMILLRLMNVNFHLFDGQHPSSFSHNESTGQVMLSYALELAHIGAPQFVQLLGHIAEYAESWRHGYFLDENSKLDTSARTELGGIC